MTANAHSCYSLFTLTTNFQAEYEEDQDLDGLRLLDELRRRGGTVSPLFDLSLF
jgi:hypothetical protein